MNLFARTGGWISLASLVTAPLAAYSLGTDVTRGRTAIWLVLIALGAVAQWFLADRWPKAKAAASKTASPDLLRWDQAVAAAALTNGVAWAGLTALSGSTDSGSLLACTLILSCSLVAFAIPYGLSPLFYPLYALPVLIAQTVLFVRHTGPLPISVFLAWWMLCLLLFSLHRVSTAIYRRGLSKSILSFEHINERLRTERDLRDRQERFSVALDTLQSGVWDYRIADEQFYFSGQFKRVLGYADDTELDARVKRPFFYHGAIHLDDRARIDTARAAFLARGAAFDEQYRLQFADRIVWIRERVTAQMSADGKPLRYTGSISDITATTEMQEQLRESERLHRSLIETLDSLIWHTDASGILNFVNERAARSLYGYEASEMLGRDLMDFASPDSQRPEVSAVFDSLALGVRLRNLEVVHLHKTGGRIYLSVNAVPLFDEERRFVGAVGINTNITQIKKRQRSFQETARLQRLIFDSAGEGMVIVRNGRVYRANQAFVDLLGATKGDVIARPLSNWFEEGGEWRRIEEQLGSMGNVIKVEQALRGLDGRSIWVLATGRLAKIEDYAQASIWVFADITFKKQQEELSWHRANHDDLTGLPNRRMLQDRLEQALAHARREGGRVGLMMLDLDGFKQVNDTYGHAVGDEVLKQIATRMLSDVRQFDTVARLGGDEFMIVLHRIDSLHDVEAHALRLIERIRQPVVVDGIDTHVGTSIGIGIFPDSDDTLLGLMHAADLAMYAAKASGKNTYRVAESGGSHGAASGRDERRSAGATERAA